MELAISQNPFSIYRGTNISDDWYFKMKEYSEEIQSVVTKLNELQLAIEEEKNFVVSQIEEKFSQEKEPKLLNLKRDVHNLRRVRLQKYSGDVCLQQLLTLLKQQEEIKTSLTETYMEAVQKSRTVLQEEIANEQLKKTILFFNRTIYKNVEKYLSKPIDQHNKKDKKLDNFIINLLMRSSMKTSPFSYLTKTGSTGNRFSITKEVNVELNHALLFRIFLESIRSDAGALKKIPVQVSKFGQRDNKIFFVTQENVPQSRKIYETSDKLVEMKIDEKVIEYLKEQQGQTIIYEEFEQFLKQHTLYSSYELEVFKKLVSTKVLVQKVTVVAERGLVKQIIEYLNDNQICETLREQFQFIEEKQRAFEIAEVEERLSIWQDIEAIIKQLSESIPSFGTEILYEDVLFGSKENKSNIDDIKDKFSQTFFQEMTSFLLLFDVNIRVQYEVAALYKEKYGNEMISLSDSNLLNQVFFEKLRYFFPYFQDMDYRYTNAIAPEVKLLDDLRDEFKESFLDYLETNDSSEIDFQKVIAPFSKRIPDSIKSGNEFSMTFFYQLYQDKVILNDIYDGQEKFLSRFKDFFGDLENSKDYKEYVEKNYYDKNYYEVTELFGFNGGIHDRVYNQKLNLELGNQRFSDTEHPNVSDFSVMYDQRSNKLQILDHAGQKARVAYKSSLVPVFLPGVLSVLLLLFQSGRINFDINYFLKKRTELPRINFENIVLYRKKWNLKLADLNKLVEQSEDDIALYLSCNEYFKEQELPETFFLKKYRLGEEISAMKPMFIDIKVPALFKHFISEIKGEQALEPLYYIEEVVPKFENELREYVVEYTIDN